MWITTNSLFSSFIKQVLNNNANKRVWREPSGRNCCPDPGRQQCCYSLLLLQALETSPLPPEHSSFLCLSGVQCQHALLRQRGALSWHPPVVRAGIWLKENRKQLIHRKIEGLPFPMRACTAGLECDCLICLTQGMGGRMLLVCLSDNSSRTLGEPPLGSSLLGCPGLPNLGREGFPLLLTSRYCSFLGGSPSLGTPTELIPGEVSWTNSIGNWSESG